MIQDRQIRHSGRLRSVTSARCPRAGRPVGPSTSLPQTHWRDSHPLRFSGHVRSPKARTCLCHQQHPARRGTGTGGHTQPSWQRISSSPAATIRVASNRPQEQFQSLGFQSGLRTLQCFAPFCVRVCDLHFPEEREAGAWERARTESPNPSDSRCTRALSDDPPEGSACVLFALSLL